MSENLQQQYDFIIAGTGCAGLSLAIHMVQSGKFTDKKILLIDRQNKNSNDRTWCFWEKEPGVFEQVVSHQWRQLWFYSQDFSRLLSIDPYEYKLIKGIDFYKYCLEIIGRQKNFTIHFEELRSISNDQGRPFVELQGRKIYAGYIFNSILFSKPVLKPKEYFLLQHFKGWIIESQSDVFNPAQATLMDFRTDQSQGTAFVYVMPFSRTRALVEYTLFSENLLGTADYEKGLKKYIEENLELKNYKVIEEEFGIIPMTNHQFPAADGNIINIGTAGGQTKASSGYTFRFIQKHAAFIVKELIAGRRPIMKAARRFNFYDTVLLDILINNKVAGEKVFSALFKKNKPQPLLRFLDNESNLREELSIISSLPTGPFLRSGIKHL